MSYNTLLGFCFGSICIQIWLFIRDRRRQDYVEKLQVALKEAAYHVERGQARLNRAGLADDVDNDWVHRGAERWRALANPYRRTPWLNNDE